jgi:hypothetical protein
MNTIKILGIDTYEYSQNKVNADITTYWRELFWKDNNYLTRYKKTYYYTL